MARRSRRGFLLFSVLWVVSVLSTLTAVTLMRSTTELSAAQGFLAIQQAFQLAEGGLDRKLAQLRTANDATNIPSTPFENGTYQVNVTKSGDVYQINSTGRVGSTSKTLRLTVKKNVPLPVLGAMTVVSEGSMGSFVRFFSSSIPSTNSTEQVAGCDVANPSACLPGLAFTNTQGYSDFANSIPSQQTTYGYFGNRLIGAVSDYTHTPFYSTQLRLQDPASGGLGYAMLESLAAFAKAQAQVNGCYFTNTNDDTTSDDSAPGPLVLENRTLGTDTDMGRKICFVDVPFQKTLDGKYIDPNKLSPSFHSARFKGLTTGAGVLVVRGEIQVRASDQFSYNGLIVSVGPWSEVELDGTVQVQGAIVNGVTQQVSAYDPLTMLSTGSPYMLTPQARVAGTGLVQYSSTQVAMAESLLAGAGWTPPSSTSFTIQAWQEP